MTEPIAPWNGRTPTPSTHAQVQIVIATNRTSPFLASALTSVAEQTMQDWEIVVVDNGVPDGDFVPDACAGMPRTRVLQVGPSTVSMARNIGCSVGKTPYVVFLDDDDVWGPGRLEHQVSALDAAPTAPASYTGGWYMDSLGRRFGQPWSAIPATAELMLAGHTPFPHICGALMVRRSSFLQVGGFSSELVMLEDFELMMRLLLLGDFACVPGELVGYRRHAGNVTDTSAANNRFRRAAMEQILRRHRWAATVRGDQEVATLLLQHLRAFRRQQAQECARSSWHEARSGNVDGLLRDASWGLTRSPDRFVRTMADRARPTSRRSAQ